MKKNIVAASASALVGLTLGASLAIAGINAGTGIQGSSHDMNKFSPSSDPYGRVCAFCHTPHHALPADASDYMPLWSHELTDLAYTKYDSASMVADIQDPLAGPSRLCMSCHDGKVAIDQHYNKAGVTGIDVANGDGGGTRFNDLFNQAGNTKRGGINVGSDGDLSNDHPVGFKYADVVAAMPNDIYDENTQFLDNPANKTIGDCLTNGYMTCATCHDVHNKDNVADAGFTYNFFLYSPQADSKICLSCHNK